jgi:GNAT superfamily N-acetyltransferase
MSGEVRILGAGDESRLFSFLEKHLESSMFLVSNAELGGLVDRGERFQAAYAANLVGGSITSVAAHGWSGNLLVQGDDGLELASKAAVASSGRSVKGIVGPLALVRRARTALGLDAAPVARDLVDRLFTLELDQLRVPEMLGDADFALRLPTESEISETLAGWRAAYLEEVLGQAHTEETRERAVGEMRAWRGDENVWVLTRRGALVSMTGFNAKTRGIVQVGGVYTPPELRRNGYARAAVAASLLVERARGATRSTLFTGVENVGALRAYTTLGYEEKGDFELLLLR